MHVRTAVRWMRHPMCSVQHWTCFRWWDNPDPGQTLVWNPDIDLWNAQEPIGARGSSLTTLGTGGAGDLWWWAQGVPGRGRRVGP